VTRSPERASPVPEVGRAGRCRCVRRSRPGGRRAAGRSAGRGAPGAGRPPLASPGPLPDTWGGPCDATSS
jgi:hypothetical protein